MHEVKPLEAINEGDRATVTKTITEADGAMYIASTGDFGPVHVDQGFAAGTRFGERIAPGIMVAGICTSILTGQLVGILGVSIEDRFWFTGPVLYGDTITFDVWIAEKRTEDRTVIWEASARNQNGLEVLKARASLKWPRPDGVRMLARKSHQLSAAPIAVAPYSLKPLRQRLRLQQRVSALSVRAARHSASRRSRER